MVNTTAMFFNRVIAISISPQRTYRSLGGVAILA
jgi:hypothetical protein